MLEEVTPSVLLLEDEPQPAATSASAATATNHAIGFLFVSFIIPPVARSSNSRAGCTARSNRATQEACERAYSALDPTRPDEYRNNQHKPVDGEREVRPDLVGERERLREVIRPVR
jgi:hypothetical protein